LSPTPEVKTLRTTFDVKAVVPEQRIIEGYAAVGGNLDRVRDVIDHAANVKAAQTPVGEIGVFIGHQASDLPIGRCIELRADGGGLHSKTYVFPTTRGDDLLQTAKALQDAGSALGMSIGYRTNDFIYEQREGKTVRVIKSYELAEYSFAARQVIANPRALVTSVKSSKTGAPGSFDAARQSLYCALVEMFPDAHPGIEDVYPDHLIYSLGGSDSSAVAYYQAPYTMGQDGGCEIGSPTTVRPSWVAAPAMSEQAGMGGMGDGGMADMMAGKSLAEQKAEWSTAEVNALPDSCFLYIESGGAKDDEGKTVPRSLRHFPYKDAEGKIDLPHLRNAIARIPQSSVLDDAGKARLQARARRMLDNMQGGKTIDPEGAEWSNGAAIAVAAIGYQLIDAAEEIATELKAMSLLGSDTKNNGRLRPEQRQRLTSLAAELGRLVEHAELIDREQDGAAKVAHYRRSLELLEV
jgi:HK97 family phage prohead protease